jgi:hypothetical protein
VARKELMHPIQLELIESLREQSRKLAAGELLPEAIAILTEKFQPLPKNIFLLYVIPEQGEDLYIFALGTETICTVEIPRGGEPGFIDSTETFRDYRKRSLTKQLNRKLDAIETIARR